MRIATLLIVGAALVAGYASRSLGPRISERPAPVPAVGDARALPLRIVDAGGVGIRADSAAWGGSYSHGTGAFHDLITPGSAAVDTDALRAIECDWRTYIDRMARWGANGVVVPAFLELIDFDRVALPIYDGADAFYRVRHAGLRRAYGDLFAEARAAGLDVYLKTDMLALTPPLERALRATTGLRTDDARLWDVYAAGLDELFDGMPDVRGVVVRIGEAGALYNADGWEYRSAMAVRTPAELRVMLRTLLPVFERHDRMLILRSWTVGVGALGALHTDPDVYAAVLGDIDSPALIVSTKYTQGDYFSYLPANPTLRTGGHRRLIEFQARREFEGFGAFPDFLAADHAEALRVSAANPQIAGISLWTQEGGPLHASPMSLYPVHGFWRWIDANVYATLRLAREPGTSPRHLAADWARETVSGDPVVVDAVTAVLLRSRRAVEQALYIRPYATRDVRALGVESTPMMWIMEWDVVGDWSLVSSAVYRAARDSIPQTIAEGFAALDEVRSMRVSLARAMARSDAPVLAEMDRSLAYQESLFATLACWRATLLEHYGWLDTGDARAHAAARASAASFAYEARRHLDTWGGDLDFPAYDFAPALAAVDRMERDDAAKTGARLVLACAGLLLLLGVPRRETAGVLAIGLAGLAVAFTLSFASPRLAGGSATLLATFAFALRTGWTGERRTARAFAACAPLLPVLLLGVALVAIRGPGYAWYRFFTSAELRFALGALLVGGTLFTLLAAHREGAVDRRTRDGAGVTLLAAGGALLVLSVLVPDLPRLLGALDTLGIAPVRTALIVAVTSYVGVPGWIVEIPLFLGTLSVGAGLFLRLGGRAGSP